jgi:hypothetical protein
MFAPGAGLAPNTGFATKALYAARASARACVAMAQFGALTLAEFGPVVDVVQV